MLRRGNGQLHGLSNAGNESADHAGRFLQTVSAGGEKKRRAEGHGLQEFPAVHGNLSEPAQPDIPETDGFAGVAV